MKKTIGILAHVDAGKTTFSEQILYKTGTTRTLGRVDTGTSSLDSDEMEQRRGITIFSGISGFTYRGDDYYLLDTPGHMDFACETERVLQVLDYAVLLISATAGVQAHTVSLFRLLKEYRIPTIYFINKMDVGREHLEGVMTDIEQKLSGDILLIQNQKDIEEFREEWLELYREQECYPVFYGSALKDEGIEFFLNGLSVLTGTNYEEKETDSFVGQVYQIRHDEKGNRLTFLKVLSGQLAVKDVLSYQEGETKSEEKINEIRRYRGRQFVSGNVAKSGEIIAATGLKKTCSGDMIRVGVSMENRHSKSFFSPALQSKIVVLDDEEPERCYRQLLMLTDEDPMLRVSYERRTRELRIHVMGEIQLEVLEEMIPKRFGFHVRFEKPTIEYRETIAAPVTGYGHFEPLRHYAEVQIALEPGERGSGITFESVCHVDTLGANYQNLIKTHIFEKEHVGVLTGSPLTDVKVVLKDGRAHLKHTEGGDFREATYRAVRHGLCKAESVLLEPWYRFDIYVSQEYAGRVMSDITKLRGIFEAPQMLESMMYIKGRGPVESFMDYQQQLLSFTGGTGSMSYVADGYEVCDIAEEVIAEIGYDCDSDLENPAGSVFCAKGTSFVVGWQEAERYMHTAYDL
ncbi:MAG: GTP-binding protein [Lachnospiraceae bacterium]